MSKLQPPTQISQLVYPPAILQIKMSHRLNTIQQHLQSQKTNRIIHNRTTYPLDRTTLRNILYEEKYRKILDECFDVISKNKHIFHHGDIEDYDRAEERVKTAQMVLTYHKLRPAKTLNIEEDPHSVSITAHGAYNFDPGFSVRTDITLFLYTKSLLAFCQPDSAIHKNFIHKALTAKHIGCFALTQIGHGSDTKNIETEAIYDHATRSFILNTPNDRALKFWIGGSAEIATHGLIWAQLIIKGKKYGAHPFIAPLRERKTMKLLDGVMIGDCGSKNGLHNIDNGYIGFNKYRIPVENALDRISGVDSQGQFRTIQDNLDKRHGMYISPLSIGRSFITIQSMAVSANSLLIAIKYSCIRRQFQGAQKKEEQLLIDYPLVRFRLMPLLASTFVFFMGGANILKSYDQNFKQMLKPKSKIANELHGISAAAKARSSWFATEVIATCRQLLGGHGYSGFSRLGRLYNDQDVNTTWQGDNHMLLQQSVKYILKTVKILRETSNPANILNFVNQQINLPQKWSKDSILTIDLLEKIAHKRLLDIHDELVGYMFELKSNQLEDMDIWNQVQPYHGKKLSLLYADVFYFAVFKQKISEMPEPIKEVSEQCLRLWSLFNLEKDRWGTVEVRAIIQQQIQQLCNWLAPRSISLVEALAAPEQIIDSPFADWNGDKMWDKYLGLIYAGKQTFSRVPYYQQIVDARNA